MKESKAPKMQLYSLHIFKWVHENPILLTSAYDVSKLWFYQRGIAKEHLAHNSRVIAGRIKPGQRGTIGLENNLGICYCWCTSENLCATMITNKEYTERIAFCVLYDLINDFVGYFKTNLDRIMETTVDINLKYPNIKEMIKVWQKPEENDKFLQIERTLTEVTGIMRKNLEEILKKGEKLDSLMEKSHDLSSVSVNFYKKAKKNNQCCKLY